MNRPKALGQCMIEKHCLGFAVGDQIPQLGFDIAVIHVAGRSPKLERREFRFHVLVAVVQRECDIAARIYSGIRQRPGKASGPVLKLGPCPRDPAVVQR